MEVPTLHLPAMYAPPDTNRAPVVEDVEAVVFVMLTTPLLERAVNVPNEVIRELFKLMTLVVRTSGEETVKTDSLVASLVVRELSDDNVRYSVSSEICCG